MKEWKYVMQDEMSRTSRIRCGEHKAALVKRENSNLWEYGGSEFGYKVKRSFHRDSL